jgi:SAM-dependent methyltransferase
LCLTPIEPAEAIVQGKDEISDMSSNAYAELAAEYYDAFHKTCRNFDSATSAALGRQPVTLPANGLILEVGCGRGRCQEFLRAPGDRVVQLDACREMLALEDREPAIVQVLADATSVPLMDSQFSAVVGFLIDSFIGLKFFAEAHRLLKPGGLLLVTTPAAEWGQSLRGRQDPEISSARFVTMDRRTVVVPSTLIADTRIAEMVAYSGFESISVTAASLPAGAAPVSLDVETAAVRRGVPVRELPLVYIVTGRKPTA